VVFQLGNTALGLHTFPQPPAPDDRFDEHRIGLDHVSLAARPCRQAHSGRSPGTVDSRAHVIDRAVAGPPPNLVIDALRRCGPALADCLHEDASEPGCVGCRPELEGHRDGATARAKPPRWRSRHWPPESDGGQRHDVARDPRPLLSCCPGRQGVAVYVIACRKLAVALSAGVRYVELPGDPVAGGRKRAESKPSVESPVKGERSVASREACRVVRGPAFGRGPGEPSRRQGPCARDPGSGRRVCTARPGGDPPGRSTRGRLAD
jgi:hypothetical protein